jgi:TolB-like protein/DNA-binding winged helix-turn-helix (wHTH) protein/Tfp pilus assembly protein PilF
VSNTTQTNGFYEFGPYRLNSRTLLLLRDGATVSLTPKVLLTLQALVERAGEVVSKEELLRSVWPDTHVEESNLAQNISVLRKALGTAPGGRPYIETVAKRGYRFIAEVRTQPACSPPAAATIAPEAVPIAITPRSFKRTATTLIGVVLVLVAAGGMTLYQRERATSAATIRSIAVLPFKNSSGDPDQDYLADGITELLTTELGRALPVRVTSPNSAMRFRGSNRSISAMARELNADSLVEGSVTQTGDRLRVTAHLIHAPTDRDLWAETYDRDITNIELLGEEIARRIAREIRVVAAPSGQNHAAYANRNAFEAYLRARYYVGQRTAPDVKKAITWYEKAIEEDPAYAAPYAGLADCYNQLGTVMIGGRSPSESRKLAMAAANRALTIDPGLAEAHAALAYSNLYDWNWTAAAQEFDRALRLDSNYPSAHLWFAHYLSARGQFDRALQEMRLASDLDPLSEIIQTQIAWTLAHARRYPEAIRQYRKVLADYPDYQWALWVFGQAQTDIHDYDASIETLTRAAQLGNRSPSSLGALGRAYALAGRPREAQALLDELLRLSHDRYVPPHAFVHIYIGLGDRDKAFEWLDKSYLERSNSLLWLGVSPLFDPLRADPRFDGLLRRVGLKEVRVPRDAVGQIGPNLAPN